MAKLNFLGGKVQILDGSGDPLSGGKVYFYEPGTSTAKDTYTDSSLGTANANPVILDSAGRATIWLSGDYKVTVHTSADVLVYTEDNINPTTSENEDSFNLVDNGSFEDNTLGDDKTPDGWTLTEYSGATVSLDSTDQNHGLKSMKFVSTGSGGGNIIQDEFFRCSPNADIHVTFLMKASVADIRTLVEIVWYDSAQSEISTTSILDDSSTNPTSWTQKYGSATPPSTARFAKLRMYGCHPSDATSGTVWFDGVMVHQRDGLLHGNTTGDVLFINADSKPEVGVHVPKGYFTGFEISNNGSDAAHDLDVAAGVARDDGNTHTISLTSALTKQIDAAWDAGDDAGGMDTGAVAADTPYAVWAILNPTTDAVDVLFSTSFTSPTMPSGYTKKRLVAAVHTDGSSNIIAFTQHGDYFSYNVSVTDVSDSTLGSGETGTFSVPPKSVAHYEIRLDNATTTDQDDFEVHILPTDVTSGGRRVFMVEPSGSTLDQIRAQGFVSVDGSSQFTYQAYENAGAGTLTIYARGYWFSQIMRDNQ